MWAGYSLRHLHESRVDQRLESIEKAVRKDIKCLLIGFLMSLVWLKLLNRLLLALLCFFSSEEAFSRIIMFVLYKSQLLFCFVFHVQFKFDSGSCNCCLKLLLCFFGLLLLNVYALYCRSFCYQGLLFSCSGICFCSYDFKTVNCFVLFAYCCLWFMLFNCIVFVFRFFLSVSTLSSRMLQTHIFYPLCVCVFFMTLKQLLLCFFGLLQPIKVSFPAPLRFSLDFDIGLWSSILMADEKQSFRRPFRN